MRHLLALAAFVVIAGIAFAYSGIGSNGETHTLKSCDFAAMAANPDVTACWDAKNGNVVMDSGRYTWNDRTGVLTNYGDK